MSNYAGLKNTIDQNIYPNSRMEITAQQLAGTLKTIVDSIGSGFIYKGIVTPQSSPGTPDQNVFYVGGPGTYENLGTPSKTVDEGYLGFFKYNGSWSFETVQVGDANAVKYIVQSLSSSQKEQARTNIDAASLAEVQSIKGDLYGTEIVHVTGTIIQAEGTTYSKLIYKETSGKFETSNNITSWLFPMEDNTTYVIDFNNLGCWGVIKNNVIANGTTVIWGDNYPHTSMQYVNDGEYPTRVTLTGKSGNYLYLRADTTSGGRPFPEAITFDREEGGRNGIFVLKENIANAVVEEDPNPVSGGAVYEALDAILSYLPQVCDETGRVDIDWNSLTFSNLSPNTTTSNNKRVLSALIPQRDRALSLNARLKSSATGWWINLLVYDASSASWIDKDGASTGGKGAGELATINYPVPFQSNGIRIYMGKSDDSNISPAQAKAVIEELYFSVPTGCELVPAASEEYVDEAVANVKREISILFIGNSLTQDAVSYVPFLLKNLRPNVAFKFYVWYNGGYTLDQQYTKFVNNQTCQIFSVCENTDKWTNSNNSVRMSDILSSYRFDIVCLQEYFNYKETYTDVTDFNNCVSYIKSNYPHEFKVVSLFHAPLRASADSVFAITKAGNELILKQTVAESLLAPGVAVYRALSTALDSLGDQGHLSPDGTHTQEGLPCLLQAFVVFIWLMRQLAIPASIINCQLRMTTAIYNTLSIPGPNLGTGVIQGTDAENLLAQDVAALADKEGQGMLFEAFIAFGQ